MRYKNNRRRPSVWLNGREYKWSDKFRDYVDWIPTGNGKAIPKTYKEALAEQQAKEEFKELQAQEELKEIYADLVARRQKKTSRKLYKGASPSPLKPKLNPALPNGRSPSPA